MVRLAKFMLLVPMLGLMSLCGWVCIYCRGVGFPPPSSRGQALRGRMGTGMGPRIREDNGWGKGGDRTGGRSFLFYSFAGVLCLELIRFGNRIRARLIDFVPEID